MKPNNNLVEALANSREFHDYENAYSEATGMPVTLVPAESWQLPLHGKSCENPFCALIASRSRTCAGCLRMQEALRQKASNEAAAMDCTYGLCEAAVPVRLGNDTVGYLQTGQVMRQAPNARQFNNVMKQLSNDGVSFDVEGMKKAYFKTPVIAPKKLDSMVHLLKAFADHLSMKANQIVLQQANAEPPVITRAKQFIEEHHADDISLGQVAAAVHTSAFYFCKLFKKATGFNFTVFVLRVRSEKAKNLLLNPNLRISEIAYEVGFQSLTHFNRVFKKIVGQTPTEYRSKLPKAV